MVLSSGELLKPARESREHEDRRSEQVIIGPIEAHLLPIVDRITLATGYVRITTMA
jgi:hypothetical protein